MTTSPFCSIRPTSEYLFFSLQAFALAFFISTQAGNLLAEKAAANGDAGELQAGLGGFFDSATTCKIGRSNVDFGQNLGQLAQVSVP
jgi:hypothetical protein